MNYDFDTPVDRRGSGSVKWDTTPEGVIAMWVADMDFKAAPCISQALTRRVEHGVFGYTEVPDDYYKALGSWFSRRHGYKIERESVIYVPGVIPALSASIKAFTRPGDGVIFQTPAYNHFYTSVKNNGCHLIENRLCRVDLPEGGFRYDIDFEHLEECASRDDAKVMIICNPHNPVGRLWTYDELLRMAEICRRHDVVVLCDEIHCDLTLPGNRFVSAGTLPEEYSGHLVIFNSPSKAFNTAGLQIANIIAPDASMRARIDRAVNDNEVCDVNPFGVAGLIAAYNEGEDWLNQLVAYIKQNYDYMRGFMAEHLPDAPVCRLEATYLVWVDASRYNADGDAVAQHLLDKAGVRVSPGSIYGDGRYLRFNIACPRSVLAEALERIAATGLK